MEKSLLKNVLSDLKNQGRCQGLLGASINDFDDALEQAVEKKFIMIFELLIYFSCSMLA
jgi:hypothetical protein